MANFSNLQNDLRKVFKSMYSGYDFPYEQVNDLITKIGGAVAADSYADFMKKFPNRAGMQEEWQASTFDNWRKNQIMRLMQAQQNQQLKIGRLINNARAEGKAYENVVKAYTGDISRKHAVFEMRNASANLNAEINKNRMQEVGIDCYKWSTSGDDRVRKKPPNRHDIMEGLICRFDDPTVRYDARNKIWVARDPDAVHLHPGKDFNCRCVALPYLMEIDEETGKYAKGTADIEKIEERLIEKEFEQEAVQELAEEKPAIEEPPALSKEEMAQFKENLEYMLKSIKSVDEDAAKLQDIYMKQIKDKIESDINLQRVISRTRVKLEFNSFYQTHFDSDENLIRVAIFFDANGYYDIKTSSLWHELMHAYVHHNKVGSKYLRNLYDITEKDFSQFESYKKVFDSINGDRKSLDTDLQEFWKTFIRKNVELENYNMSSSSMVGITDFMHGSISNVLTEQEIIDLDLEENYRKSVIDVVEEYEKKNKEITTKWDKGRWHNPDYYIKKGEKKGHDKQLELAANEFQANIGSVYFTDRKLFNAYKKILPNATEAVENFIKNGE
jgi:hypothetical protein